LVYEEAWGISNQCSVISVQWDAIAYCVFRVYLFTCVPVYLSTN